MSKHTLSSLFVILAVAAGAEGCSSSTTGSGEPSSSSGTPSSSGAVAATDTYGGTYGGTYQGDARGSVSMTITGQAIDVTVEVGGKNYAASGVIKGDGGVSVGIGTGDGVTVTFQGTFTSTKGSGTWTSSLSTRGTWSVAK